MEDSDINEDYDMAYVLGGYQERLERDNHNMSIKRMKLSVDNSSIFKPKIVKSNLLTAFT